jgi:hypothetical protein
MIQFSSMLRTFVGIVTIGIPTVSGALILPSIIAHASSSVLTYDFEQLAAGDIHGQDNWVTVNNVHNPANVTHKIGSGISSQYSSFNATKAVYFDWEGSGYGSRSTRINNQSFSTPTIGPTDITVIEFDANRAFWGSQFRMGYDANADGDIADNELGLRLYIRSVGSTWKVKLDVGTQSYESNVTVGHYGRYQIVLDRTQDTASVWLKNYSANIDWAPIIALSNVADGFTSDSTRNDPTSWNGFGFHGEGRTSAFDNVSFRQLTTPARTLEFLQVNVNTTQQQTVQISGQYFTESLSATVTGDFTFDDGTQARTVGVGSAVGIRFRPTTEGLRSGVLTLSHAQMNQPLVIALSGTGTIYVPPVTTTTEIANVTTTAGVSTTIASSEIRPRNSKDSNSPATASASGATDTFPSTITPTSTTSTSTTIPNVDRSVILVDGKVTEGSITSDAAAIRIEAGPVLVRIRALDNEGNSIGLSPTGQLQLSDAVALGVSAKGLLPESEVRVWMRSTPILLGSSTVSDAGTIDESFNISAPDGEHRIIFDGVNELSQSVTMGIGADATSSESSANTVILIIIPLAIAIAFAVFLPPVIRRSRNQVI